MRRVALRRAQPEALMSVREARKALKKHPDQCAIAVLQSVQAGTEDPTKTTTSKTEDVTKNLPAGVQLILEEFQDVLQEPPPGLPLERAVQHDIPLEAGTKPIFKRGWRLSPLWQRHNVRSRSCWTRAGYACQRAPVLN